LAILRLSAVERAAWDPGFYCLDQPIAVGVTDEFAFWRVVRDFHRDRGPEKLVFYNTVWHSTDVMLAHGTIKAILHPDLGQILEVDTSGDYLIRLVDGTTLRVTASSGRGRSKRPGRSPRPGKHTRCDHYRPSSTGGW